MNDKAKTAVERFGNGYNCAQAVASVFWSEYGVDEEVGFSLTRSMGGGFQNGEICGAAAGAASLLGFAANDNVAETRRFLAQFKEVGGGIRCADLLGALPWERAEWPAEKLAWKKNLCEGLVENAVTILVDMGY